MSEPVVFYWAILANGELVAIFVKREDAADFAKHQYVDCVVQEFPAVVQGVIHVGKNE